VPLLVGTISIEPFVGCPLDAENHAAGRPSPTHAANHAGNAQPARMHLGTLRPKARPKPPPGGRVRPHSTQKRFSFNIGETTSEGEENEHRGLSRASRTITVSHGAISLRALVVLYRTEPNWTHASLRAPPAALRDHCLFVLV
jgi:hypothetical protein